MPSPSHYIAIPKAGSGPGVLVLHSLWGLNTSFKDLCDRFADAGFVAPAPDLYDGKVASTPAAAKKLRELKGGKEAVRQLVFPSSLRTERSVFIDPCHTLGFVPESSVKTENARPMTSDKPSPTDREIRNWAEELVKEQNTITIATAHADIPWAAPVYYVNLGFTFYFFSDPASRHIQESIDKKQAAAAVFRQASTWREIRGIQMSGTISPVSVGMEALRVVRAYLKKFPFTEEFFDQGQELDLEAFAKRFRVRLYRFQPTLMYYLDNRVRFSFREKVHL